MESSPFFASQRHLADLGHVLFTPLATVYKHRWLPSIITMDHILDCDIRRCTRRSPLGTNTIFANPHWQSRGDLFAENQSSLERAHS